MEKKKEKRGEKGVDFFVFLYYDYYFMCVFFLLTVFVLTSVFLFVCIENKNKKEQEISIHREIKIGVELITLNKQKIKSKR